MSTDHCCYHDPGTGAELIALESSTHFSLYVGLEDGIVNITRNGTQITARRLCDVAIAMLQAARYNMDDDEWASVEVEFKKIWR